MLGVAVGHACSKDGLRVINFKRDYVIPHPTKIDNLCIGNVSSLAMNSIAALKCRVLIENVSTITDLSDGEESDIHHLFEEVISLLSTPSVTEISQNLDTMVKEMIDQLKRAYI